MTIAIMAPELSATYGFEREIREVSAEPSLKADEPLKAVKGRRETGERTRHFERIPNMLQVEMEKNRKRCGLGWSIGEGGRSQGSQGPRKLILHILFLALFSLRGEPTTDKP